MLPLLMAFVVFFFLVVGAVFFAICALFPPSRRYALSTALWWASWGPCSAGAFLLFVLLALAGGLAMQAAEWRHWHLPSHLTWVAYASLIAAVVFNICAATFLAYLHEAVVKRMTFALFRIYATLVTAGVGSVFGLCFGFWLLSTPQIPYRWLLSVAGMTVLVGAFGLVGYRRTAQLRGRPAESRTWITKEEFHGTVPELPVE